MTWRVYLVWLAVLAVGCSPRAPADERAPVIFVLDSEVDRDFVEGRVAGLQASDVTHGSLVARVILSYCRTRLVSVPVEGLGEGIDREVYLDGLRSVLDYVGRHPDARVVVNVSLSSPEPGAEEEDLIGRLAAAGVLVVAAAGNDDTDAPGYPAAYPDVIAVASATPGGKALRSNYGPHVDIAASGDVSFIDCEFLPHEWLLRQMEARGTSFAAPRVAATVAYVLAHSPDLSPAEAFRVVASTARPIDSDLFREGMLGAGLLDVGRVKALVTRGYRFAHFVLPVCVWLVLGAASVYLCWRHGLLGAFATLMIWSVGLPASYLLVVQTGEWLEFVGRGSIVIGLGVATALSAGLAISLAVQAGNVAKAVLAAAVPYGLLVIAAGAGLVSGFDAVYLACAAAAVVLAASFAWESATRKRLQALTAVPPGPGSGGAEPLLMAYRSTLDRRVRRAAIRALGWSNDEAAVAFLLEERRYPGLDVRALARILRRDVGPAVPALTGYGGLLRDRQRRLLLALRKAGNPAAVPHLERIARADRSPDVRETLAALQPAPHEPEA